VFLYPFDRIPQAGKKKETAEVNEIDKCETNCCIEVKNSIKYK
jgi:hypothetical protein